jgi:hypothetical protein
MGCIRNEIVENRKALREQGSRKKLNREAREGCAKDAKANR